MAGDPNLVDEIGEYRIRMVGGMYHAVGPGCVRLGPPVKTQRAARAQIKKAMEPKAEGDE